MTRTSPVGRGHWKPSEVAVLQRHYATKWLVWAGWDELLPGRTRSAISSKASALGLRYESDAVSVEYVQLDASTCGECVHYREGGDGRGRCAERHAVGMFGRAPEVSAHYDASICKDRKGRTVRVEHGRD